MQVAVLWSIVVAVVLVAGAALLWQRQLLRELREREQGMQRQLAHASGFALAGDDKGNYTLSMATAAASITPKPITPNCATPAVVLTLPCMDSPS